MKVKNKYDLITSDKCFDIHKEPLNEIINEMNVFIKMLKSIELGGQDSYPLSFLYVHSFSVLDQILEEYFRIFGR